MSKPLRVLMVEDTEDDALLTIRALTKGGYEPVYQRVETAEAMLTALREKTWDVILCDYRMPQFSGFAAIELLQDTGIDLPLIIVSSTSGEETAADCMRYGARDWVMKSNLSRLVPAIERELKEAESRNKIKQAEEKLRESDERYKALFDRSLDLVYITDFEGRFIDANDAALNRFGYAKEEIQSLNFASLLSEDQLPLAFKTLQEIRETGLQKSLKEFRLRHKDGTHVYVESQGSAVLFNGKPAAIQAIARDITERKRAEEMLRQSETRYRELFDNISSGVAIYEVTNNGNDFIFKDFNRAGERLDGDRKEDIIGKSIYQVRPGINEYGLLEVFKRVWATGIPEHYPAKFYQDEKLQGWYDNFVYRLPSGEIVAVYDDITSRKQAEIALLKSEESFRAVAENAYDGIIIALSTGAHVYANKHSSEITGYSVEELLKKKMKEIAHPDEALKLSEMLKKRIDGEEIPRRYETVIVHKLGNTVPLEIMGAKTFWHGQTADLVIFHDITERKRAEEALRKSQEQLREAHRLAHIGVWNWVAATDTVFWTEELYRIAGLDPLLPAPTYAEHANLYAQESWDLLQETVDRAMKTGGTYQLELKLIRPDGTHRWINAFGGATYDNQGRIEGLQGTVQDITERKKAEDDLRTSRLQLRALYTRLQQIREEEGIRISREIHDEMGGGLTGLKMDLSWLLRKMGDADLGETRIALMDKIHTANALIDQMIHVVRRISTDLRPSILDDLGLIATLEWQLSEFTSRNEISHEFATTCEYVNMEEATAVAVFRIFQEALTNVVRHSRATKVAVVFREGERSLIGDGSFVLEIRDNGRGITEEEILNPESLGLLGMKERVLAFGGELSIHGEPGGGTVLVLQIPQQKIPSLQA